MVYINSRADDVEFSNTARKRIAGRFLLGIQRDSATVFLMEVEPTMEILLKRAYEAADRADGFREILLGAVPSPEWECRPVRRVAALARC